MLHPSIWIGYDPRWPEAFGVCRFSLRRRSSRPIPIGGVHLDELRRRGFYTRAIEREEYGPGVYQLRDPISEAPMATEFSNSRFLTPHLAGWKGWAIFLDCDFLALRDPAALFRLLDDRYAVMCCKHLHEVPPGAVKMDGQAQLGAIDPRAKGFYGRKNWSSMMAFNCEHPSNAGLTLELINSVPGRDLHRFCWLADDEIGALPLEWNFLVGHTDPQISPAFVHFTDGMPNLPGYEQCAFADEWRRERALWIAGDMAA